MSNTSFGQIVSPLGGVGTALKRAKGGSVKPKPKGALQHLMIIVIPHVAPVGALGQASARRGARK